MQIARLADTVLLIHFAIVAFVVAGLPTIVIGNWLQWGWVNAYGFRVLHLAAIVVISAQAWLGQYCPLTVLESWLRVQAGGAAYGASFVQHWLERLFYFNAPLWVFAVVYTLFAALVALVWWFYPPSRSQARHTAATRSR
jgi:Protein of Unknown function (DUF2784)